jgi:hypothetical protein
MFDSKIEDNGSFLPQTGKNQGNGVKKQTNQPTNPLTH